MTDFRIIGLEIKQLGWKWGAVRDLEAEEFEGDETDSGESEEETEGDLAQDKPDMADVKQESKDTDESVVKPDAADTKTKVKAEAEDSKQTDKKADAKPVKVKDAVKQEETAQKDSKPEAMGTRSVRIPSQLKH